MNSKPSIEDIKITLLEEHNRIWQYAKLSFNRHYVEYAGELIKREIEGLQTYDDIEYFINHTRRMSLNEWIYSL